MDRKVFLDELSSIKPLEEYEKDIIIEDNMDACKEITGNYNQILSICMEENAELSVAVSKAIRNKLDKVNLLEEMADVMIGIKLLQTIYEIDDIYLEKAIAVKLKRVENKVNKGEMYK